MAYALLFIIHYSFFITSLFIFHFSFLIIYSIFADVNKKDNEMRRFIIVAVMALGVLAARAVGYNEARQEALFLTDKMAYELGLNQAQYDAVYEINFDYFMSVNSSKDIKGTYLSRRNYDINFVLTPMQYSKFYKADYFYTPAKWSNGVVLKVYTRYTNRSKMYYPMPRSYRYYRGEHGKKYNNISWYKGKDFKSSHAIRSNGHDITYGSGTSTGHGIRSGHNSNTNRHGHSIGTGAKPGKHNSGIGHGVTTGKKKPNKNNSGIGHGATTGKKKPTKENNTGIGSGVSIGSGAGTNSTGIGHGVGTRSH